MSLLRPPSQLGASNDSRNEDPFSREEGQNRHAQTAKSLSGTSGGRKVTRKLTEAHSGSTRLKIAEAGSIAAHYPPRAFEDLEGKA